MLMLQDFKCMFGNFVDTRCYRARLYRKLWAGASPLNVLHKLFRKCKKLRFAFFREICITRDSFGCLHAIAFGRSDVVVQNVSNII